MSSPFRQPGRGVKIDLGGRIDSDHGRRTTPARRDLVHVVPPDRKGDLAGTCSRLPPMMLPVPGISQIAVAPPPLDGDLPQLTAVS